MGNAVARPLARVHVVTVASCFFWCDKCDPLSTGARRPRIIYSLIELLQHVDWNAGGNRGCKRRMVRQLAEAKGLPKRVGENQAMEFFSQAPTQHGDVMGLSMMVRRPACRWKPPRFPMKRR
jgi:hypothetical protein